MASVSAGPNRPCSKMSAMIGCARIASPTADGTFRKATCRSADPSVARTASMSFSAARCATPAPATVAIATPNTPSGSCMSRNANCSQLFAPTSCEANQVFTTMFTCVADRPITAGPMRRAIRRTPGSARSARESRGRGRKPERDELRHLHGELEDAARHASRPTSPPPRGAAATRPPTARARPRLTRR